MSIKGVEDVKSRFLCRVSFSAGGGLVLRLMWFN